MTAAPVVADPLARYIARQPIYDAQRYLSGYELLYRAHGGATAAGASVGALQMSGNTLVAGVLDIGLDRLVGRAPAWINCPRELLVSGALEVLDPRRVVLEILESVTPDPEVISACTHLRRLGYALALDDFEGGDEWAPLLEVSRFVKLDVLNVPLDTLKLRVARLRAYPVRLVAERVEDAAVFSACRTLGFSLFQGYYFQRPEVLGRRSLPTGMVRIAKLMALVQDTRVSDAELEEELRSDPGLSVKLLRIVNNAATGHHHVASLRHAIQLAGRRTLYQWLALLLVSSVPASNDVEREAILVALERGRFCELLALDAGRRDQADPLFLAGLLADLDRLLGITREELIAQLGLADEVAAALRGEPGPHTPYLAMAHAYTQGAWDEVASSAPRLGVHETELPELFGEAGGWARKILAAP